MTRGVSVREGSPLDRTTWDLLACQNSSLLQSTLSDGAESYFAQKPVYFEDWESGRLVGGVKLWQRDDARLGPVSAWMTRTLQQFGEGLLASDAAATAGTWARIGDAVRGYCRRRGVSTLRVVGYYGSGRPLLWFEDRPALNRQAFHVAWVDLAAPLADVERRIDPAHRYEARKAARAGLTFREGCDVEVLIGLLAEAYRDNPGKMPDAGYLRHLHGVYGRSGATAVYAAWEGSAPISAALVAVYGKVGYYAYGGSRRPSGGASQFLHWNLIKLLHGQGAERYVLGQVAVAADPTNPRFSVGISRFKRLWGVVEEPSQAALYVMDPLRFRAHAMARAVMRGWKGALGAVPAPRSRGLD